MINKTQKTGNKGVKAPQNKNAQNENKKGGKKPFKKSGGKFRKSAESYFQGNLTLNWYAAAYHRIAKVIVDPTPGGFRVLDGVYPPLDRVSVPQFGSYQTKVRNKSGLQIMTVMKCPSGMFWTVMDLREAWFAKYDARVKTIVGSHKVVEVKTDQGSMFFPRRTNGMWSDTYLKKGDRIHTGQVIGGPDRSPRMFRPRIIKISGFHIKKLEAHTGLNWEPDNRELDRMYDRMSMRDFHRLTKPRNEDVVDTEAYRQGTWAGLRSMYSDHTRRMERGVEVSGAQPYAAALVDRVIEGSLDHAADLEGSDPEVVGEAPESLTPRDLGLTTPKYSSYEDSANRRKRPPQPGQKASKERPAHVSHGRILVGK
jgi:hypothetical protein